MASEGLHEAVDLLDEATIDHHRAMTSLCEELEAVDWYDQRVMTLEWLRRRDPKLDEHLRTYLFTSGSILEIESEAESAPATASGSLGIGSLKGRES
jgi:hypothetical protein